ncbi:Lysoplasmalogenase-like protein TMEM86A [Armadillidium nasatum]|uniref:lysoplasmalogenase n=1 Tax=Armadillidium nasatum TaxID=96803 RepID=A0A5N5T6R4_9CRUS|nr:Lysoplasmalogenase-like protein TMEM86A [Armadillidium nasatum]
MIIKVTLKYLLKYSDSFFTLLKPCFRKLTENLDVYFIAKSLMDYKLKAIGPKLVPFFKTVAIYFLLFIPVGQPSLFAAFIKCLPVISLIAFVLLHGMSLGDEYAYSRRVLLGLIMSAFGDALLVWDETFLHGLGVFFVAQLFYISAFGFQPFNIYVCTVVFGIMSLYYNAIRKWSFKRWGSFVRDRPHDDGMASCGTSSTFRRIVDLDKTLFLHWWNSFCNI